MRRTMVPPAFLWAPPSARTEGTDAAKLAESAGLDLDLEQRLVLDTLLGKDSAGQWSAFEAGVIMARQNGKTRALHALVLADLFLFDAELIVWTAHLFDTAQEAFRDIAALIDGAPHLRRHVKAVHRARGDEGIELKNGRRLNFLARSKTGGRGLSGDRVIFDEAFALGETEMGSLLPTLSARPNPQVVYASSAGLESSGVLRSIRDRGRSGGDPTLAYVEWADPKPGGCADPRCAHQLGVDGCALDDLERVARANPTLGRRITVAHVLAERRALPPLEYARERLGWWDDPPETESSPFPLVDWLRMADPDAPRGAKPAFGVDIGVDRVAHIAVAWRRPDERVQVMLADGAGLSSLRVPARVAELVARWGGTVALGGTSAGLEVDVPGSRLIGAGEFAAACGRFADLFAEQRLRHGNQPALNEAVRAARWRPAGASGERSLQLRDAPGVGPLAAVVRAVHGVLAVPPPKPPAQPVMEAGGPPSETSDIMAMEF